MVRPATIQDLAMVKDIQSLNVVEAAFLKKPNLLQVRVEHRSEKQVARLQQEVASLHTEVEKQQHLDQKFLGRLDLLSRRIDGLQEAFKTGDVKHIVVVSRARVLGTNPRTFLCCLSAAIIYNFVFTKS